MATDPATIEVPAATTEPPAVTPQDAYDAASFYADEKPQDAPVDQSVADETPAEPQPEPIERPKSWGNDQAERWGAIPREAQEFIAQRERSVQAEITRAQQQAASTRQEVETQARNVLVQQHQQHAEALTRLAQMSGLPTPPDASLLASGDPEHARLYMLQNARYTAAASHATELQKAAESARQQAEHLQSQARQQAIQADEARLAERWPQWSEPSERAKLLATLQPIAAELGYGPEAQAEANADDLFALDKISGWKAKAEKYDSLMKQRMEPVRAAKQTPPAMRAAAPTNGARQPQDISAILYPDDKPRP